MLKRNYSIDILVENATTFSEKTRLSALTEAEQAVINDKMVGNIYKSALKKRDIDFDNIPYSKGDVQQFNGYDNIVGTLSIVRELSKKFGIKIEELDVVEDALSNLRTHKAIFQKGFALDNEFMILYYNTLVYACVESTSLILSSYVEYVKTINTVEFRLKKGKGIHGNICITNLKKFNKSVKSGEFVKFTKGMLDQGKQNFVGGGVAAVTAITLAASIVPILRELVYFVFESRMAISQFLDQQAEFLEMNKVRVNASSMSAPERNKVLDKQSAAINKLESLSDKIKVNHQLTDKAAATKIKQDNKEWTLKSVSGNDDGFLFV